MSEHSSQTSSGNVPAWMVTFADLMALMMTFFVLLYSFSKVDEERYKSIVSSMAQGFDGVQWIKRRLLKGEFIGPEPGVISSPPLQIITVETTLSAPPEPVAQTTEDGTIQATETDRLFSQLDQELENEIAINLIYIERNGNNVIIRFPENVSFTSGSDQLVDDFIPIIHRIAIILHDPQWKLSIAGHTDDNPISTPRFRSNWELSVSRAVSVAHTLLETNQVDSSQLVVTGHADTRPLVGNDNDNNRTRNRRVEIIITKNENRPDIEMGLSE